MTATSAIECSVMITRGVAKRGVAKRSIVSRFLDPLTPPRLGHAVHPGSVLRPLLHPPQPRAGQRRLRYLLHPTRQVLGTRLQVSGAWECMSKSKSVRPKVRYSLPKKGIYVCH